jgi:hypothetical protein
MKYVPPLETCNSYNIKTLRWMALVVFSFHKLSHAYILTNRQLQLLAWELSDKNMLIPDLTKVGHLLVPRYNVQNCTNRQTQNWIIRNPSLHNRV